MKKLQCTACSSTQLTETAAERYVCDYCGTRMIRDDMGSLLPEELKRVHRESHRAILIFGFLGVVTIIFAFAVVILLFVAPDKNETTELSP